MPLTPQQRSERLLGFGYDPTKYELGDDEVSVYERDETPVVQDTPVTVSAQPREMSTFDVAKAVTPRAIAPTLGGFAGGALGGAAAGTLAAGPVGTVAGSILGGLAGGFGTGWLQDKINPPTPEEAQLMQRARVERPLTSLAFETAPALIAMRPSPATLKNAATGVRQLTTRGAGTAMLPTLAPQQIAAMANVGVGAGLGAGTEMAASLAADQPIDWTRVAGAAAANALITDPNRIGQKLFRFSPSSGVVEPRLDIANTRGVDLTQNYRAPRPVADSPDMAMAKQDAKLDELYEQVYPDIAAKMELERVEQATHQQKLVDSQLELARAQRDAEIADIEAQTEMYRRMTQPWVGDELVKPAATLERSDTVPFTRPSSTIGRPLPTEPSSIASMAALAPVEVRGEVPTPRSVDIQPAPQGRPPEADIPFAPELPSRYGGLPRNPEVVPAEPTTRVQSAAELTAKPGRSLYADEGGGIVGETKDLLTKQGVEFSPMLNKDTRKFAAALSKRLGYDYVETTDKIINPANGDEVPGQAFVDRLIAEFNPTVTRSEKSKPAGLDTPIHEPFHIFVEELRRNGTPFEKKMIARGEELLGGNERLVERGGVGGVYRLYDKSHPVAKYLRDLWSHIKVRFGSKSGEDYSKWLVARMMETPTVPKRVAGDTGPSTRVSTDAQQFAEEGSSQAPKQYKAQYIGEQPKVDGTSFSLYNLTESIGRIPKGTTVTEETLTKLGLEVPPKPPVRAEEGSELQKYLNDKAKEKAQIFDYVDEAFIREEQNTTEGLTIEDVLDGDTRIFRKYPYLKKVYVELVRDNHRAINGEAARAITLGDGDGTIYLNEKYWDDALNGKDVEGREQLRDALVHELAHFVQDKEGRLDNYKIDPSMHEQEADEFTRIYAERGSQIAPNIERKVSLASDEGRKRMTEMKQKLGVTETPASDAGSRKALATLDRQKLAEEGSAVEQPTSSTEQDTRHAIAPVLTSQIDKVRTLGDSGNYAADRALANEKLRSRYEGLYAEDAKRVVQDAQLSPAEDTALRRYLHDMRHTGSSEIELTPAMRSLLDDEIRPRIRGIADDAATRDIKIYNDEGDGRFIRQNPNYFPDVLSADVAAEWSKNSASPQSLEYIDEMTRWLMQHDTKIREIESPEDAYKAAYTVAEQYARAVGSGEAHDSAEFAALRRAAGVGLPLSLTEPSLERSVYRYGRRVARDFAFWETIQSDKVARKILGVRDAEGNMVSPDDEVQLPTGNIATRLDGSKDVQALKRSILGKTVQEFPRIRAAAKTVGNMIMQFGTGVRDMASIPLNSLPYVGMGEGMRLGLRAVGGVFDDWKGAVSRARRAGAVKQNFSDFIYGDPDPVNSKLNTMSNFFAKWGGREITERASRTITFALGEEFAKSKFVAAKAGDREAQRLLKRMSASVLDGVDRYFDPSTTVPDEVVTRIAKEFTDAVQGSYGESGLPTWAIEGSVAPFVSLQRWSIEKANTIYKDVIRPMKSGNYAPFLRYSLGAMMSGVAIEQLNELLSGHKGYDPTVAEVTQADEAEVDDYAKKFVALMQMAGYGGIVSDVAKLGVTAAGGNYSKYNSPLNYPLYSYVTETLTGNISDYVEAMRLGEDPFRVTAQLVKELTTQSLQNARYLRNYVEAGETERKELNRDLRVWREMSGRAGAQATPDYNRFVGVEEREFKNTQSPERAMELASTLTSRYLDEEDPRKMAQKFNSLRRMNIPWMPSLDESPEEFMAYSKYVEDTAGKENANRKLSKYTAQRQMNEVKKTLVPKLEVD